VSGTLAAVDLPGHGPNAIRLTPAEAHPRALATAVADEVAGLGIERPHVVGHSLGGWVALEMAVLGRVASVLALAPAGLWRDGATIPLEVEATLLHHWLSLVDPVLPVLTRLPFVKQLGLRSNMLDPGRVTDEQLLAAARALAQAKSYAVCDRAAVDHRFEGREAVDVPTTVAFGDSDRILPPATSQERSLLPAHAEWVVIPRCGHAMTWDQPEQCVRLVGETADRS
jgi:pimeloyl-ACP methyl ester carboxylesterase